MLNNRLHLSALQNRIARVIEELYRITTWAEKISINNGKKIIIIKLMKWWFLIKEKKTNFVEMGWISHFY